MVKLTRRDLGRAGFAAGVSTMWHGPALGSSTNVDPFLAVAPEFRPAARAIEAVLEQSPPMSDATIVDLRQRMRALAKPPLAEVPVVRRSISVRGGAPDVMIMIVNAKPGGARPGILHTHGGGFVAGSAAADLRDLQELAQAVDCTIISVEYRLAPETTFRGSIEDNYAGLLWLYQHADEMGVDPSRLAVLGESAGGGHAALLAITARDRGEVPLRLQCLLYPMLDDRTGSSNRILPPIGSLIWTGTRNRYGWRSFLGMEPGTDLVPAAAVPARVASVVGLPPAFIGVGSIDLFVQEDVAYAGRLIAAGIGTELLIVPGAYHGFDKVAADTPTSQQFTAAKIAALRRAFRTA